MNEQESTEQIYTNTWRIKNGHLHYDGPILSLLRTHESFMSGAITLIQPTTTTTSWVRKWFSESDGKLVFRLNKTEGQQ